MKLNFEFWVSYEANKPIFTGFNRNLYFQPFWPTKARQYLMLWKSRFLPKLSWNRQKSHGLTTNNGSFEMARLRFPKIPNFWKFEQVWPVFVNLCYSLWLYLYEVYGKIPVFQLGGRSSSRFTDWYVSQKE